MLHMSADDIPVRFIAESIGSFVSELSVIKESPSQVNDNFQQMQSGIYLFILFISKIRNTYNENMIKQLVYIKTV